MDIIFLIAAFLLGGVEEGAALSVTADAWTDVEIKCVHSNADTNVKYFCKDPCRDVDVLITSQKADPTGKYTLRDGRNTFYVTVHHLTVEDSGTYHCGVERLGVDTFNDVILRVDENEMLTESPVHDDSLNQPVFLPVVMSVAAILFVCIFTLCLIKHQRAGRRQNRDVSPDYVNMPPSVIPAGTKPGCSGSGPPVDSPKPPDLGSHLSEKNRESALSDLGDYVSVDTPTHAGQYQCLDLGRLENPVYHTIGGHQGPKDGPQEDKDQIHHRRV